MGVDTKKPEAVLSIEKMSKYYPVGQGFRSRQKLRALHEVDFEVGRGEVVALVGESGSGKSTIARQIMRLEQPDSGRILFEGQDVLKEEPRGASLSYRQKVQMIFQDPFGSLNPVHTIIHHLVRPLLRHGKCTKAQARGRALELLTEVGLEPAADFADRHPYELSGGQRQRVAIARALAVEPTLIVADEPTSMLDVSIRVGVLNLLERLRQQHRLSFIFITHDLASAYHLADRVLVLYAGQIVEEAPTAKLLSEPAHPYTRLLLAATPQASASIHQPLPATSGHPELVNPSPGCAFAPRCPLAMDQCRQSMPKAHLIGPDHRSRCHLHASETSHTGGPNASALIP